MKQQKTLRQLIQVAKNMVATTIGAKPKVLLISHEKRAYERQLRAAGRSRAEAVAMVAKKYGNRG